RLPLGQHGAVGCGRGLAGLMSLGLTLFVTSRRQTRFQRFQVFAQPLRMDRRNERDLLEQPRDEALREHELRKHGALDVVAETACDRGALAQQQRVEKALDLSRVALRTTGQDGTDLVAERKRIVRLLGLLAECRLDSRYVQTAAGPRPLQLFPSDGDQLPIV